MSRLQRGSQRRMRAIHRLWRDTAVPPRKEDAPCCRERRDGQGRLPIGFCSDECLRRPDVWTRHLETLP